jgi:hypothetical protein
MILLNIGILAVVGAVVWWLTGADTGFSAAGDRNRFLPRALRSAIVLFLFAVFLWFAEGGGDGAGGIPLLLIIPVSIALLLRNSIAERFSHGFIRLLDPMVHDDQEVDLKRAQRHRENIAWLIHNGKREAAIKLCEELKQSGELDEVTLEMVLGFLDVKQENTKTSSPLSQAAQLRSQGKFSAAEQLLKSLLKKNPEDTGAAVMLMRLYAEDWHEPDKAMEILRKLEKQPHVSKDHLDFARHSLVEWNHPKPMTGEPEPKSVDNLLAKGFVGSAIEELEQQLKARPRDFGLWLKLAEIHAVHCDNISRAEKIIRQMEGISSAEQLALAEAKLKEWRKTRLQRK